MGSSQEIIRDQDGHFRHPKGYPLVVIFDSKPEDKTPAEISWQQPIVGSFPKPTEDTTPVQSKVPKPDTRPLKFINTTRQKSFNPQTKKLIRTHVVNDCYRRKREHLGSARKSCETRSAPAPNAISCKKTPHFNPEELTFRKVMSIPRPPLNITDPFDSFPVKMEPYMHGLIHRYIILTASPVKFPQQDPGKDVSARGWLPLAMTDAALFHSLLCGSALSQDLKTGRGDSVQGFKHMKEAIHLLSVRLQSLGPKISDSTIISVAHLAEFESMMSNFVNWKLHVDGLYKMIQVRGGFEALSNSVKGKVWSADISGCLSTLSKPRFPPAEAISLSLPFLQYPQQPISTLCEGLRNIIEMCDLDSNLISVFAELQYLNSTLGISTRNLMTTYHVHASVQYHLLMFRSTSYSDGQISTIQELCSLGAITYLKTVYDFRRSISTGRPPTGASTDIVTIQQLKSCLESIEINTPQTQAFFLWMLFLGGSVVAGTKERTWFVARLARTIVEMQIRSWEDTRELFKRFLWVDWIHGDPCRELWDEAMVIVDVLFGGRINRTDDLATDKRSWDAERNQTYVDSHHSSNFI